jgi:hypothetical protein
VVSFYEFKQSLRAARVAQQFCMWWNFSITALETFLINNDFLSEKVPSGARGVSILSSFCHHVVLLISLAWCCKKPFLGMVDLGSIWSSWAPGNLASGEVAKEPKAGPSRAAGGGAKKGGGQGKYLLCLWIRIRIHKSEVKIQIRHRILLSPSKYSRKNLDHICFVTSCVFFFFDKCCKCTFVPRKMAKKWQGSAI